MSIAKEVMTVAEQWAGVRPELSDVLLAMQDGLHGRVETAYGMTEPHAMPGVACGQGHECSPVRSKIMAAFIQETAAAVCRGYRFGRTAVPQLWYADDSVFICEDLAGVQLAADALWVVTRVAGLNVTIKDKDFETKVVRRRHGWAPTTMTRASSVKSPAPTSCYRTGARCRR